MHIAYSQQLTQSLFCIAIGNLESMAYQAISPMGNTGIFSYKAVVTTFASTSQYIPCFMYVSVEATVLNIQH